VNKRLLTIAAQIEVRLRRLYEECRRQRVDVLEVTLLQARRSRIRTR